jgi:heme-degrading monooxygenase HmoA
MFMVEEIVDIALGRHVAGRQYIQNLFDLMREKPGFRNAQLAAYCGNIRQHMILTFWEDADGYQQWLTSPEAKKLGEAGRPYRVRPGAGKFWELFLDTPGPEQGNFLNQGILQVRDLDRWEEFLEQRHEHDANAKAAGGLVYVQSYKYVGEVEEPHFTPRTTAIQVRRTGRAAYERSVETNAGKEAAHSKPAYISLSPQLTDRTGLHDIIYEVNPADAPRAVQSVSGVA